MTVRAVVLLSGGLDSMLAVRLLQLQGLQVEAVNFRTQFACCQDQSAQAAAELGVPLTVVAQRDDYLDVVRRPAHGYGRGANPCVDCRIYMFRLAAARMRDCGAQFVASGEVVGQRPMSQKKRDLAVIAHHSGLDDRLLRPLSAQLLPETWPERHGLVDRRRLRAFSGRGRKELIALAQELGLRRIPQPSTGCALTEPQFAAKVYDLLGHGAADAWQFGLLRVGRHVRCDARTKIVVGRREAENEQIAQLFAERGDQAAALVVPRNFQGPTALVVGTVVEASLELAAGLVLRYAKADAAAPWLVEIDDGQRRWLRATSRHPTALAAATL